MEEILASIRQIISEDGGEPEGGEAKAAQSTKPESSFEDVMAEEAAAVEAASEEDAEIVEAEAVEDVEAEIAEDDVETEPESAPFQGEPMTPQSLSAAAAEPRESFATAPRQESAPAAATSQVSASSAAEALLSAESGNAVHGAFSALAHTILAQNARTLEDLVAEMLQPMLRNWLDENLPALVERLVQEEIQRVSRGKR